MNFNCSPAIQGAGAGGKTNHIISDKAKQLVRTGFLMYNIFGGSTNNVQYNNS